MNKKNMMSQNNKLCFFVSIFYKIVNSAISFIKIVLFTEGKKYSDIDKILIYRIGTLGDNITAMPSIKNIIDNFPNSTKIDLLVSGGSNNLLSMDKLIDHKYFNSIINYSNYKKKTLIRQLKNNNYDLVIELPSNLSTFIANIRNMLFFRFVIGIEKGFGWNVSTIKLFKHLQDKCIKFENEINRLQAILRSNNIKTNDTKFILKTTSNAKYIYNKYNILHSEYIALVVGAKREQNRWPIGYFQKVIDFLIARDYSVILIGGREDLKITKKLSKNNNMINLCGKLTPLESAEVLKKCKLLITNDTGPMHLAYAVNTPIIALFSSRDYRDKWHPPCSDNNTVLRNNDIECKLCFTEKCSNNICLQEIKPKEVINELHKRNV